MSYTPKTWHTGDTVTATAMNNIEQGIVNAGAVIIVTATWDDNKNGYTIDKTPAEIEAASSSGFVCRVAGELSTWITAFSTPQGPLLSIEPYMHVEYGYTPPLLVYQYFDWDSANSVITERDYSYTLTPSK